MAKKDPTTTPRGQIKNAFRQLWLRSRERSWALKQTKYCCTACRVKQSAAKGREQKIEVHHACGRIDWDQLVKNFVETVLKTEGGLIPLCPECHKKEHEK